MDCLTGPPPGAVMPKLEFFFDFSSPWTYMAFTRIGPICAETGAKLVWKPFYVAAVFREANREVAAKRAVPVPAKRDYHWTDMQRWADRLGIRIGRPPVYGGGSKPLNSAKALRGAFHAIDRGVIAEYAAATFQAYWEELKDISDPAVLADIAADVGMDAAMFLDQMDGAAARDRFRANTDELIRRGGFGTPTFFVDDSQLYFGNDRLDFVRDALLASG
jgi:2-hydroxychromene-2-carboxylate isomerase